MTTSVQEKPNTQNVTYSWTLFKLVRTKQCAHFRNDENLFCFLFYICLSVCRIVKGTTCRKVAHCFFLVSIKKHSYLISCVFEYSWKWIAPAVQVLVRDQVHFPSSSSSSIVIMLICFCVCTYLLPSVLVGGGKGYRVHCNQLVNFVLFL